MKLWTGWKRGSTYISLYKAKAIMNSALTDSDLTLSQQEATLIPVCLYCNDIAEGQFQTIMNSSPSRNMLQLRMGNPIVECSASLWL